MNEPKKLSYVEYQLQQGSWPEWKCEWWEVELTGSKHEKYLVAEGAVGVGGLVFSSFLYDTIAGVGGILVTGYLSLCATAILCCLTVRKFRALKQEHQARAENVPLDVKPLCYEDASTYSKLRLNAAKIHYYSEPIQEFGLSLMAMSCAFFPFTIAVSCPFLSLIAVATFLLGTMIHVGAKCAQFATQQSFWPKINNEAAETELKELDKSVVSISVS